MADWNLDSPTYRGMQFRPSHDQVAQLNAATRGRAMRFKGTAATYSHVHLYLEEAKNNPGLAIEIVDTLQPVLSAGGPYFPNTDSGAVTTGWETQAGSAVVANIRAALDDQFDNTDYVRNVAATSKNVALDLLFRVNTSALSATRVTKVLIKAAIALSTATGNSKNVTVSGLVDRAGTRYATTAPVTLPRDGRFNIYTIGEWTFDPVTDRPWTQANFNRFLDNTNDEFGIRLLGRSAAQGVQIAGLWLEPVICTENRKGRYYQTGQPRKGWTEYTLTDTAALSANTYYWLVVSPLVGTANDYLKLRVLIPSRGLAGQSSLVQSASPAATTGEHRTAYDVLLATAGGPVKVDDAQSNGVTEIVGGQIAALLDVSGAIQTQSAAFAEVDFATVVSGGIANQGYQITTDGAPPAYAGWQQPVGWADVNKRPAQPLRIELRSGVGAITGGGTLHRVGFVNPQDLATGQVTDLLVPFTAESGGSFTPSATTQYHTIFSSASKFGWKLPYLDTRSDLIGAGTTLAEIEGASQNGQTDSWVSAGVALDRYDFPGALVASPAGLAGLTVTVVPGVAGKQAPYNRVAWTASAFTTAFAGYNVYARPARANARPWVLRGQIRVPTGRTPATVEAQHNSFLDFEAGWSQTGGQWETGWDYTVTSLQTNGLETQLATIVARKVLPADTTDDAWLVSNAAPWLNHPITIPGLDSDDDDEFRQYQIAGADQETTRTRLERPSRKVKVKFDDYFLGFYGEDRLRNFREAARGYPLCLHAPTGDRWLGALGNVKSKQQRDDILTGEFLFVETTRLATPAEFNVPAGLVLDGTSDYITHADNTLLDPAVSAFSVVCAARFPSGAFVPLSKGNLGVSDGYGFVTTTTQMSWWVDGTSAVANPAETSPVWFDGDVHVAVGTTSGTSQKLYRDGATTPVAVFSAAHGAVTNAVALVAGANNGGASGFAALDLLRAYAVYLRELTAAEAQAASFYLLGYPGYRMPAGPVLFVDLRDSECWDGIQTTVVDQSGNGLNGTVVGGPPTRGLVAPLGNLEAY